jgi:glycosyltransferase involved in cell wall biosynthesis
MPGNSHIPPFSTVQASLLIPCYNAARFLPRLAEGVRAQTMPFTEVICYDDGSSDKTVAVVESLGWRVLSPNANRGVSFARNRLAEAASFEWIHFHDADDLIDPRFLERLSAEALSDRDAVTCDADWIAEKDGSLQIAWRYDANEIARDPATYLLAHPMSLNNTLVRRSMWLGVGGCDESLAMWEDADVHFRLALAGARWGHVSAVLTSAMRNDATFSHDYRRNWRCRLQALTSYSKLPAARHLAPSIAEQAETTASFLLSLGDRAGARDALSLARRLGRTVPTTHNPLLRLVRALFPPIVALDLQRRFRP